MRNLILANALEDMVRDFNRFSVGFEPTFRMLDQVRHSTNGGYPPYDLETIDENSYRLSMAVAGFTESDLDITLTNGLLTIEGRTTNDEQKTYLHKGIAGRSFKRAFYLNNWVRVTGSNLSNGILTIDFVRELPESMKPRKITIGGTVDHQTVLEA